MIDPARKCIVVDRASASFEPRQKAGSHIVGDLELDGPTGLLLNDDRTSPFLRSCNHIANPDFYQITAAKLIVDRKIEQGSIPDASLAVKEEADGPDLLLG